MKKHLIPAVLLILLSASSCNKYLEVEPVGKVIPQSAEDYRQLLTSAYGVFPSHKGLLALRTDELQMNEYAEDAAYYEDIFTWNDAGADASTTVFPYQSFYKAVFISNEIIDKAEGNAGKTAEVDQIRGEAYLLRAYSHFELLNLYAKPYNKATAASDRGIVLSTKTDLEQKYVPSSVEAVYAQIFTDIQQAENLVNVNEFEAGKGYRFTRKALMAFKARAFLYRAEWDKALEASQAVLALNNELEDLNDSESVLPNHYRSKESIMALEATLIPQIGRNVYLAADFLNLYNQQGDLRFGRYFSKSGSRYNPLKTGSDDLNVTFRNAEMYLIQAEAAYHLGDASSARTSLLALKAKRYTPAAYSAEEQWVLALNGPALLTEILQERRRELALEGHRWYDLRRTTQPKIVHSFNGEEFTLQQGDPKYTLRFPAEAVSNNPNLSNN